MLEKLEQFKKALKACNYSEKTQAVYFKAVRKLFYRYRLQTDTLTTAEINQFIIEQEVSPSQTIILNAAIKAYFSLCLDRQIKTIKVIREETTPEILTEKEVYRFLQSCPNLREKAIFSTVYFLGLRRQEILNLAVKDITAAGITIRNSKGADRIIKPPTNLINLLRTYWKEYRPINLMFEISESELRQDFNKILVLAEIGRPATLHSLRHSCATHLYNNGGDIIAIKNLLGHKSLNSTLIYTKYGKQGAELPQLQRRENLR